MILGIKVAALLIWTALSLGAYMLIDVFGDAALRNADILPLGPRGLELLSGVLAFLQKMGLGFIVFLWLCGVTVILLIGWMVHRLARRRERWSASEPEPFHREDLPRLGHGP
jgi:hypothetical protein